MNTEVEQVQISDLALWFGKMYPELLAQTKEQTSEQSCKKQSGLSAKKPPLFLCLMTAGPQAAASLEWGGDWSVAWRVLDAQFWGVPQRRRRIALVTDFGGLTAPEILFEREGVSGYYPQGRTPWERATRTAESRSGTAGTRVAPTYCIQGNCIDRADTAGCNGRGWTEGVSYTLNTVDRPAVSAKQLPLADVASTLRSGAGAPKHEADVKGRLVLSEDSSAVYDARGNGDGKIAPTMTGDHQNRVTDYTAVAVTPKEKAQGVDGYNAALTGDKAATLGVNCGMSSGRNGVIALDRAAFNQGENAQYNFRISEDGINSTLVAKGPSAVCAFHGQASESADISASESSAPTLMRSRQVDVLDKMIVRRLTPLECERLQGFPDGWTDIGDYEKTDKYGRKLKSKPITDSARYKALGNSIAIPPWFYVLSKLTLCCGSDNTMASLFDGIGGFPLIWETLNGKGSCLWASEIEEFPIAVTKVRFPQEETL